MFGALGDMVVRLIGDATSYLGMIHSSTSATRQAAQEIQKSGTQAEQSWSKSMHALGSSTASILASYNLKGTLTNLFQEFAQHETIITRFNAAIQMSGQNAAQVVPEMEQWAKSISGVTTASKDNVLSMLAEVEGMGLHGEKAKMVIQNAISIARLTGGSAQGHIFEAAQLQQGEVGRLRRKLGLVGMKEGTVELQEAQKKLNQAFQVEVEATKKSQGQIIQLKNSYQILKQELGAVVDEAMHPLIGYTKLAVDWFRQLDPQIKQTAIIVGIVAASFVSLFAALKTGAFLFGIMGSGIGVLLAAITGVGAGLAYWVQSVGGLGNAWKIVEEKAMRAYDYISYYTQKFIDYATPLWGRFTSWLSDNWENIKGVILGVLSAIGTAGVASLGLLKIGADIAYDGISYLVVSFRELWETNSSLVIGIAATVAIFYTLYKAISLVIIVSNALKITTIINTALWIAWKLVILAWYAVVVVAIGVYSVLTGTISLQSAAMFVLSLILLPLKLIYWLLTAAVSAFTVANLIATASVIISIAIIGALVVLVGIALYAAVMGAVGGIMALGEGLKAIFNNGSGPLNYMTGLFAQWKGIFADIIYLMKEDMPSALKYIGAAFELMVAQLRALWPPFWAYLKDGFSVLWEYVLTMVSIKTRRAAEEAYKASLNWGTTAEAQALNRAAIRAKYGTEEIEAGVELSKGTKALKFKAPYQPKESDFIEDHGQFLALSEAEKDVVKKYGNLLHVKEEAMNKILRKKVLAIFGFGDIIPTHTLNKMGDEAFKAGDLVGEKLYQGFKQHKLDSALVGSAEALARTVAYREQLHIGDIHEATLLPSPVARSRASTPQEHYERQITVLEAIKAILERQEKGGAVIKAAHLTGQ